MTTIGRTFLDVPGISRADPRAALINIATELNPHFRDISKALNGGLTILENFQVMVRDLEINLPSEWTDFTVGGGFQAFPNPSFGFAPPGWRAVTTPDGYDKIELRGLIQAVGGVLPNVQTIINSSLPKGKWRFRFGIYGALELVNSQLVYNPTAHVKTLPDSTLLSLDDLFYEAADRAYRYKPKELPVYLDIKPTMVFCAGVLDITGKSTKAVTILPEIDWFYDISTKQTVITNIQGLPTERKYRVRVVAIV